MIALTLAALAAAANTVPATDPLAPALGGKLQCHTPDTTRKTCRSLAGYSRNADGSYTNKATVLLAPSPVVTMAITTPVRVKAGAVCGTLAAEPIDAATIAVDGQTLAGDDDRNAKSQIKAAMQPILGQEICSRYTPAGDGFDVSGTVGGKPSPEGDQHMIWVSPADGYTVAP